MARTILLRNTKYSGEWVLDAQMKGDEFKDGGVPG
jgi:hypothetical protein